MDAAWLGILEERVPFFAKFEDPLRQKFIDELRIFVAEKHWIPAGGMEITDEVRVTIAAAAVRLTLHLELDLYNRLTELVIYPSHYVHEDRDGIVLGEAHSWGTVVLSWDAVVHGLANPGDGHDTATHEFAHVLDGVDGDFDGAPRLRAANHYGPWAETLGHYYEKLVDGDRKARRVLRDYGATNEAEFFAVATESFFEKADQMKRHAPELYKELARFYGFDPAAD